MPTPEEIEQQRILLKRHRDTLSNYVERQAILGLAHTTPEISNGIKDSRHNIRRIKKILRGWGEEVEDHPDDELYGTSLTHLSDADLRRKALDLVSRIRDFITAWSIDSSAFVNGLVDASTLLQHSDTTRQEYRRHFKVETTMFRQELIARLPSNMGLDTSLHYDPVNLIGMSLVADDLEELVKSLPDS